MEKEKEVTNFKVGETYAYPPYQTPVLAELVITKINTKEKTITLSMGKKK